MSKLYVFGIGGTGARVLKSLTMLLATGVECGVDTIIPIIIDRDKGNGDYSRTNGLIKSYISVNKAAPKNNKEQNIKNRFFNTDIKLLGNELLLKLDDETKRFEDFIGLSTQSVENKAMSQMQFSKNTLAMDTEYGFRGHPNIGSVVLNQFDDKNIFKAFASDFETGDKIFIISSIFGGTGASGFPLLRKMLQTTNLKDTSGTELQNWGLINEAPIGAISVLPYFNVDKKDNVDSDTFNDKTRAALSYYETEDGKLDTLYYIADTNRKAYKYAEGGEEQENDAHFVELSAALSILDFVNVDKKNINFQKDEDGKRKTIYKEFGINSDTQVVSFCDLAPETQKIVVNPLSRFMLFSKYMGYTIVKKSEDGNDKYVTEQVPKFDIFNEEHKHQPYARFRFTGDFRNKISDLESIQRQFFEWLQEMNQQSRRFSPFDLTTTDAFNFVSGDIGLFTSNITNRNWAKVDSELNRQIRITNKSLPKEGRFIELFYRATEALIDQTSQNNGSGSEKYIFRLQKEGDFGLVNTIEHWGVSDMYGEKQRSAIKSSNEKSNNQPTSIPSPFARIALVKTAFTEVATYGKNALMAYQKIVSDTLDIAEIFFTYYKWKNEVEIITWKYGRKENSFELEDDSDLKKLENGHRQLYKTLKTFLEKDAEEYNFDKMKCIYILKHTKSGDMIGATSPSTLFFSSANDYGNISIQLTSKRKAFEGVIPLSERNWDFQKYIYTWFAEYNETRLSKHGRNKFYFHEFYKYIENQKPLINRTAEIDKLSKIKTDKYIILRSPDVEVLGKPIHQIKELPAHSLTVHDIFEDKIIRIPYQIQKESFFDGNLPNDQKNSYLLPIKDKFFQYYSINDLIEFIRINQSGDVVKVELRIGAINHSKKYTKSNGEIIDTTFDFDCAIFPNVRFNDDELAFYRFGIVCEFEEKDKFNAEYMKRNSRIDKANKRFAIRNEKDGHNKQMKIYSLEHSNFDYIRISYESISGIVIPELEDREGNYEFAFAVDFGTTNTHIEYKTRKESERTFDISNNPIDEKQIHYFHGKDYSINKVFDEEFISLYTDEEFRFPMRTALSFGQGTKWNNVYPFEKACFNELYEKRLDFTYNTTETDLKWSNDENYKQMVEVYIKSLLFMIRNKVVIGNGDLRLTKIVWFYPVSMDKDRYDNLEATWQKTFKYYFGGSNDNISSLTESVAPYKYYLEDGDSCNLVTIDIGGGTTDMVISANGTIDSITSFRFAANTIFGDGYATNHRVKNGIIRQFFDPIKDELLSNIDNKQDSLFNIFNDIYSNRSSDNIASFLFSLSKNKTVKTKGQNLAENANLNQKLVEDNSQKITFVFFYAGIIYHLAKLMKAKKCEMPDKIVFSGNGSRVIQFITKDTSVLVEFTKIIFEKVYNKDFHQNNLKIERNELNPKEATCKGGLLVNELEDYKDILKKKVVLHSNGTDIVINRVVNTKEQLDDKNKYSAIDETYIQQTVEETKKFIQFVFDILPFFSNQGYKLNASYINIAKKVCYNRLDIYTKNGWELKKKEIDLNEVIDETLFFYPLTGMITGLAGAIADYIKDGANPIGFKEDNLF
jgi:hypothetical protein